MPSDSITCHICRHSRLLWRTQRTRCRTIQIVTPEPPPPSSVFHEQWSMHNTTRCISNGSKSFLHCCSIASNNSPNGSIAANNSPPMVIMLRTTLFFVILLRTTLPISNIVSNNSPYEINNTKYSKKAIEITRPYKIGSQECESEI